jgi:hypothetical protein
MVDLSRKSAGTCLHFHTQKELAQQGLGVLLQVRLVVLGDVEQGLHVRAGQGIITAQGGGNGAGVCSACQQGGRGSAYGQMQLRAQVLLKHDQPEHGAGGGGYKGHG